MLAKLIAFFRGTSSVASITSGLTALVSKLEGHVAAQHQDVAQHSLTIAQARQDLYDAYDKAEAAFDAINHKVKGAKAFAQAEIVKGETVLANIKALLGDAATAQTDVETAVAADEVAAGDVSAVVSDAQAVASSAAAVVAPVAEAIAATLPAA